MTFAEVVAVYAGSNGDATKALYARLEQHGPPGIVAVNLFRACKTSERAKAYRGRRFRGASYDRKDWSVENLATELAGPAVGVVERWGWGIDPKQEFHKHVLYVDLPTGQMSFHCAARYTGPDYPGEWDGQRGIASSRICRWVAMLLGGESIAADTND